MGAISQGELELVRFDTNQVLCELKRSLFPKMTAKVTCHFGQIESLGCINRLGEDQYAISLHTMLNHPQTPELVIRHILIHELLHIEIPARELREGEVDPRISGKRGSNPQEPLGPISHPAEFWIREGELSPDRILAMRWVFEAFRGRLKYLTREERIKVRNWRREFGRRVVRPPIEAVRTMILEEEAQYPARDEGRK